jgi:alkylation response protein AidB-like acyl-CoA dehydrogenase
MCAHLLACVVPLWQHGNEAQKRPLPARPVQRRAGRCARDHRAGLGLRHLRNAHARRARGDGWRINGTKTFISNGPVADVASCSRVTDPDKGFHGGVTAFLVERGIPGFSARAEVRQDGPAHLAGGRTGVRPTLRARAAVLGRWAAARRVHHRDGLGALPAGRGHVGTMERLLETSVAYARTRKQFGQSDRQVPGRRAPHRRHEGAARGRPAAHLPRRVAAGPAQRLAGRAITKLFVSESLVKAALDTSRCTAATASWRSTKSNVRCATRSAHDLLRHQRDAAQHHRALAGPLRPAP